jgi:hypothetical protein
MNATAEMQWRSPVYRGFSDQREIIARQGLRLPAIILKRLRGSPALSARCCSGVVTQQSSLGFSFAVMAQFLPLQK